MDTDTLEFVTYCISKLSGWLKMPQREVYRRLKESEMSVLIDEGVADLHCRSDKYLATLVWEEYSKTHDHGMYHSTK